MTRRRPSPTAGLGDVAGPLLLLTAAKAVANTAARWIPLFLPTLSRAFSVSTSRLTTVLGIGEMVGLGSLLVGRALDRGRERVIITTALALVAGASVLAVTGSFIAFAASYLLILGGVSLCTVGGHTYLSRRVPFSRRARAIGIFEMSWASALLIGAPIAALLIEVFGWRGPFVAIAVAAVVVSVMVARGDDATALLDDASDDGGRSARLTADAWIVIAASGLIGMTGLSAITLAGTWLDEDLGVSTSGIGLVAIAFGLAEITASSSSAAVADRVGPSKATRTALVLAMVGLAVMAAADSSLAVGALGLLLFFLGFEFAIVTSFSIVSEVMPSARGRVLATNNAAGTVLRGAGIIGAGVLFERHGIEGPVVLSGTAAALAVALLWIAARRLQAH